jgi:hypothetical protein
VFLIFQMEFRKSFRKSLILLAKMDISVAAHFSAGNSNCRGCKPASGGVSSPTIVRGNTGLSVHKTHLPGRAQAV